MIFITDAMRQDELDSDGLIFASPSHPPMIVVDGIHRSASIRPATLQA